MIYDVRANFNNRFLGDSAWSYWEILTFIEKQEPETGKQLEMLSMNFEVTSAESHNHA